MKKLLLILLPLAIVCLGGCTNIYEEKCTGMAEIYCSNYDVYDIEIKCIDSDIRGICMKSSCMISCEDVMLMGEYDFDGNPL